MSAHLANSADELIADFNERTRIRWEAVLSTDHLAPVAEQAPEPCVIEYQRPAVLDYLERVRAALPDARAKQLAERLHSSGRLITTGNKHAYMPAAGGPAAEILTTADVRALVLQVLGESCSDEESELILSFASLADADREADKAAGYRAAAMAND
jgi:hypothetical protein